MRTILFFVIMAFSTFAINGQTGNLKSLQKKPSGTVKPGFKYGIINGQQTLKSTAGLRYASARSLAFPGTNGDNKPLVICKGNAPIYIEKSVAPLKLASGATPEERFYAFMEESRTITKINSPRENFKITNVETDELGITHIRSVQLYKGIEIYGTESTLHLNNQKERFNGSFCLIAKDIPTTPKFSATQCLENINLDLKKLTVLKDLTPGERKLLHYDAPDYSLVIYNKGDDTVLAWKITIRPNFIEEWKYFVDATSGEFLRKYNNTKTDGPTTGSGYDLNNQMKTFDVFLQTGTYYLYNSAEDMYNATADEGLIITYDANNTSTQDLNYSYVTSANNTWNQKAAISAHVSAELTYEYLHSTFGRNSINGQGGNILSFVNVAEDDGSSMENAFWNGQAAFYGNGGTHFKPLAGALDVTAHELGHGVVSNTANLEYYGQPGAINESYADIFGSMVDRNDWTIGEDVVRTTYYPSGALRNMADPHNGGNENDNYWQPAHVSEMYLGTEDNAGVHINNGIGSHAYYLFATAHNKEKAEQVFYRALTKYLTSTSTFIDWRIAVIQSAKDLYGSGSQEAASAAEAFNAVGIQEEEVEDNPPSQDYETNPGQDYLLSYNIDPDFTGTLYRTSTSGVNFVKLTNSTMKRNVSVTDDGSRAYFVTEEDSIKGLYLDPQDLYEWIVSPDAFWDNVTISKDGNRMACISVEVDTAIYVYDFIGKTWEKFMLYNPTTSHSGTDAGGVLYADAIEFDVTGEYLIYDALNVLSSDYEEDMHYWDIGFIHVWNNASGNFGSGKISKLFTSLPKNVSVGNPVFSKNSPSIIAFDYKYDDKAVADDEVYAIYGGNLDSGLVNRITYNETWGYPSFSKNDDTIAFTALSTMGDGVIKTINLGADKITAAGSAEILVEGSVWPVYYATGDRTLGLAPVADFTADKKTGSAPLQIQFMDLSTNDPSAWLWTFQGGTPSSSTLQNPKITYNSAGTYQVSLKATNSIGNDTKTKTAYVVVSGSTGLDDAETSTAVFFPNPVFDLLTIVHNGEFAVKIFNLQGDLMLYCENQPHIDVSAMSPGIYLMELKTESGLSRHKLLKH